MATEKIGTIFKVEIPEIAIPDKYSVKKTPLGKQADVNALHSRMERIAKRVHDYLYKNFGCEANIPAMRVVDDSIRQQRVFGSTLNELSDYELYSLPDEILEDIELYTICADELNLGQNGQRDFLDVWGYDSQNNHFLKVLRALNIRFSTNLMVGYIMNETESGVWQPSDEKLWLVDPDSYLASSTGIISKYGILVAKPTAIKFFTWLFRQKYLKTINASDARPN
ncbi:hypothetical protein HZC21_02840 [Candidatus Peregrinibacteria bacterium]|nr:hypothetical protein [Candidatus Peregrinibacteria bacterium]